ncbi:MAG TPA: sugar phosphate nucleotidyltransferase [Ignavibacteriaceae bacterium]
MNEGRLVILAGGISSRMKKPVNSNLNVEEKLIEDADKKSKSMIGVGNNYRPFLDYLLFNARQSGFNDIVLVVGEKDSSIKEYYGSSENNNNFNGINISYAVQPIPLGRNKPLGTADALLWGLKSKPEWKGSKFTVCNSDNLYSQEALRLMLNSPHIAALIDYDRSALEFDISRIERFAVTTKDENGFLIDIIEKPTPEIIESVKSKSGFIGVSMNIFSFSYDVIFPILEKVPLHPERKEKELPGAVKILADEIKESVYAYPLSEHVPDLTSKEDIIQVKKYLEKKYKDLLF